LTYDLHKKTIFAAQTNAMKKIYHLSSCSTNQRILKELNVGQEVELQDIKEKNIDAKTLEFIKEKVGSYEALFSKRAMKYKSMGLNEMNLTEEEYKKYMLEEYTFLKRPFIILEDQVFIGNAAKTVETAKQAYHG
jgi:arsenate reductase (glutaredoxin)